MTQYKKDYHDLRKPYPNHYASGFSLPRYKRPQHFLTILGYEALRLSAGLVVIAVALALAVIAARV